MTFGIYRGIMPHNFDPTNKEEQQPMKNKKNSDGMLMAGKWLLAWEVLVLVTLLLGFNAGCGGSDDDTNCEVVTDTCPNDPDGGTMPDSDPDAPDADNTMTTPDGNTAGSCADYAGVTSDGWQCTLNNGLAIDMNGLRFIVEDGACRLRSDSFWCQDPPPASDVLAGQFACTDINGDSIVCWHNDL